MMRLIDADALFEILNRAAWFNNADRDEIALELVRTAPTVSPPPNDPLTLSELREMDGEPVYMIDLTGGTLWNQWIIFQKSTDDGFIPRGGGFFGKETYGKTWLAYRRKPEKKTDITSIRF